MMIHTNVLTRDEIAAAARRAGVSFERLEQKGSRKRARKFDVILEGSGRTGGAWGNSGSYGAAQYVAATWDEWGVFLAALFTADPEAWTDAYTSAEHFRWSTAGRYDGLDIAEQCKRHRWDYTGPNMTGAYAVHQCRKCDAIRRFPAYGLTFADIA